MQNGFQGVIEEAWTTYNNAFKTVHNGFKRAEEIAHANEKLVHGQFDDEVRYELLKRDDARNKHFAELLKQGQDRSGEALSLDY